MVGCFCSRYCPATENMRSDKNEVLNIFAQNGQRVYVMVFAFTFLVVSDITSLHDNKVQVHTHLSTSVSMSSSHTFVNIRQYVQFTHVCQHPSVCPVHTRLSTSVSMSSFSCTATSFHSCYTAVMPVEQRTSIRKNCNACSGPFYQVK